MFLRATLILAAALFVLRPVAMAATAVDRAEKSVVRLMEILSPAKIEAIKSELPICKTLPPDARIVRRGSGFAFNQGMVITTAEIIDFDESEVEWWLRKEVSEAKDAYELKNSLSEADKTKLDKEYEEFSEQVGAKAKKLFDDKAVLSELFLVRQNGANIEFRLCQLEKKDFVRNVAALRVDGLKMPALQLNTAEPVNGDDVFALGFPISGDDTKCLDAAMKWWRDGKKQGDVPGTPDLKRFTQPSRVGAKISRSIRQQLGSGPEVPIIEHDGKTTTGMPGGPLVNSSGQVIGVIRTPPRTDAVSSALQAGELHQLLRTWKLDLSSTERRPLETTKLIFVGLAAVALIGIASLALSFRKASSPGQATVMNWIANAQGLSRRIFNSDPPPIPAEEPPPIPGMGSGHTAYSRRPQEALSQRVPTILTGAPGGFTGAPQGGLTGPPPGGASRLIRSRYETFELAPTDEGGAVIELQGGQFAQTNGRLILGRSAELAQVYVDDRNVSKRHAAVRVRGTRLYIEDLESANGTEVNGKRLEPYRDTPIELGDTITIGKLTFRLRQART